MEHSNDLQTWTLEERSAAFPKDHETVEIALEERLRYFPGRRRVWRARAEGEPILLKVYETHAKQMRDTEREWQRACQLANAGLPIPAPLFRGRSGEGELGVAYAYISEGVTASKVLQDTNETSREAILEPLFRLLSEQHDAGCEQTDNHLGNYLWNAGSMWMLDAGSCQFSDRPLSNDARIKNLALLVATIPLRLCPSYSEIATAYGNGGTTIDASALAKAVESVRAKRLRRYLRKTRRTCTEFVCEVSAKTHWLACRDLAPTLGERLRKSPNAFFEGAELLKDGNTCTVVALDHEGQRYVLKRYNPKSLGYRLGHVGRQPRALRSWSGGHALRLFGIPTPRPMACLLVKGGRLLKEAFLLMEEASGESLHEHRFTEESLATLTEQIAQRCRELRLLRASHGDMKARNFIIADERTLTVIDLDGLQFHRQASVWKRRAMKDQARFLKNWDAQPEVHEAFTKVLKEGAS